MGAALQPESAQFRGLYHDDLVKKATKYIDEFKANNSRLPSTEEFDAWMQNSDKHSGTRYDGRGFYYSNKGPFPTSITKGFGNPPSNEDAFIFSFWDGEHSRYYASWSNDKSKTYILDSEYFVYGSKFEDVVMFFLFYCVGASVASALISYSQFKRAFITVFIISFVISALIILAMSPLLFQVKN
jgi:hypothetical protein